MTARKPCRVCGEVKPLDAFYRDKKYKDGRNSKCRACYNADDRRRRKEAMNTLGEGWKKLVGKAQHRPAHMCSICLANAECSERVRVGLWVLCERPDEADMRRLRRMEAVNG